MVYSTSRCPHCRCVIDQKRNPVHEIGNPFRQCRHCGKIYLNSYKEEWITKSPIKRLIYFIQDGVWARAIGIPFLIVVIPAIKLELDNSIMLTIYAFLSLGWLIGGYFIHKKWERENIIASLERTKDPRYVSLLEAAGYSIYPVNDADYITATSVHEEQQTNRVVSNHLNFCTKCGERRIGDFKYCTKCGEKF